MEMMTAKCVFVLCCTFPLLYFSAAVLMEANSYLVIFFRFYNYGRARGHRYFSYFFFVFTIFYNYCRAIEASGAIHGPVGEKFFVVNLGPTLLANEAGADDDF
jgi:hypothetical protein